MNTAEQLARYEARVGWHGAIPEGHYAIPDPHEAERHTMWRVKRARLESWPKTAKNGPQVTAFRTDVPRDAELRAAFWEVKRQRRTAYLADVRAAIEADPEHAAARYATVTFRCAACNRPLEVPESNGYGLGPECRSWMPADLLALYARQVSLLRAEAEATP